MQLRRGLAGQALSATASARSWPQDRRPSHHCQVSGPTDSLWRDADFLKLWSGFTVARIGSQVSALALPLTAVLILGAGATETGLLVAAQMAPSIVAGLFIGVWVDGLPRRPILIASDIGSAIVIGSIPLASPLGGVGLPQLYAVSFLRRRFALS